MVAVMKDEQKCTECGEFKKLTKKNFRPNPKMRRGFRRQCRLCEREKTRIRAQVGKIDEPVIMIYVPMNAFPEGYQLKRHIFSEMLRDDAFPDGTIVQVNMTEEFYVLEEQKMVPIEVKSRYEAHRYAQS